MQLEMVHDFKRRSKVAIDKIVSETLLSTASVDIRTSQVEMGISSESALTEEFDYPSRQRTTFLNAYLVSKLNTSLHDKVVRVEHRNGFVIYRQTYQMIDAVREDAEFHMANELTTLSKNFGQSHGPQIFVKPVTISAIGPKLQIRSS